jgi:hypothetical protein
MPLLSAETFPLLRFAESVPPAGRVKSASLHAIGPAASSPRDSDAGERPDPGYWMAYDHYMIEREARAMRRVYIWTLLARGWTALRR